MRAFIFFFFSLLAFPCLAEQFSILEAEKIQLEGKRLFLSGPLILENELGMIKAGKAVLESSKSKGKLALDSAVLEEDVTVSLVKKGDIKCQRAVYADEVMIFSCPLDDTQVMYSSDHAWTLLADELTLFFDDSDTSNIEKFVAEGTVTISNDCFFLRCKKAIYDQGILTLFEEIAIDGGEKGILTSSDTLQIKTSKQGELEFIKCCGITKYHLEDEFGLKVKSLVANGQILIDHMNKKITMRSDGKPQLFLQHGIDHIYADEAIIDYVWDDQGFHIKNVVLNKDVRLATKSDVLIRCILADHARYALTGRQFCFKCFKKNRVLLYDQLNHLQMSAPEITVEGDILDYPKIEGRGEVRFHFAEKEFEQLIKRFQLEKKVL